MQLSVFRTALVLGLLSCMGPFAIDMYLPALPRLSQDLGANISETQFTISAYFLSFGLAQLVYGPWSDQVGRRKPLYFGLAVFIIGALVCATAPTMQMLVLGRFIQGMGGAAMPVIPRAVIRDLYTGHQATRLMALVMLVISVSPMLAPLTGSAVIAFGNWRIIFGVLCLAALVGLLLTRFALKETLPETRRQPANLKRLLSRGGRLLVDRGFMGPVLIGGFGMSSFFVFIASASFVYTQHYGLTPTEFSLAFALNALGFFAASQLAANFGARFGAARVVRTAVTGFALVNLILVTLALLGWSPLGIVMLGLFLGNACLGLVIPTCMVMALDDHGEVAGLASSLGGTIQMVTGGAMVALSGPFFDGTVVPMLATIGFCAAMAFVLALLTLRRRGFAA
ncbi:multidrug effflux MFS transporter [Thioclava sp. BHET1]|nr:multidrug effflux MFS transporter [Thioclava sp. BHET1]